MHLHQMATSDHVLGWRIVSIIQPGAVVSHIGARDLRQSKISAVMLGQIKEKDRREKNGAETDKCK